MTDSRCMPIIRTALDDDSRIPTSQPVFAFGMHKAGSTMLADFLQRYTKIAGMRSLSISNLLFNNGIDDKTYREDHAIGDLLHEKLLYFGFRYLPDFILGNKARFLHHKAVILVRDPRDCVVSAYYSFLNSHVTVADRDSDMSRQIESERRRHENESIDEYALQQTGRFAEELRGYAWFMHENARLFRYEDVIFRKRRFFENVLTHLDLPFVEDAFENALQMVDILPANENQDRHIRNVHPGNHRDKLSKSVVSELNARHADVLSLFGYQ